MIGMVRVPFLKNQPTMPVVFGSSRTLLASPAPTTTQTPALFPSAAVLQSQRMPQKSDKTPLPVAEAWCRLPESLKKVLSPIVTEQTIPELSTLTQSSQMGILEEASDILYECFVLTALQTDTLKETLINRAQNHVATNLHTSETLMDTLKEVKTWINEGRTGKHEVERIAQIAGMDTETAEEMLALTYLRIGTLRIEGRFKQAEVKTRGQLKGEFWELIERLPKDVQSRLGHSIVNGGYQNMQNQFPRIVEKLTDVLQQTLGEQATPSLMHEFTRYKHYLRQGIRLAYLNHADMDYDKRKRTSKAIEALVEVALLKRIDAV